MEYRILIEKEGEHKFFFDDNDLFWNETLKPAEDDESFIVYDEALDKSMPEIAGDLGYRQAHVDMLLCLMGSHVHLPRITDYLQTSGNEMVDLFRVDSCIKYRVLISTRILDVRRRTAEGYVKGYKRAMAEILARMIADGYTTEKIKEMRSLIMDSIRESIRKYQPDGLFDEYMDLYGEIT